MNTLRKTAINIGALSGLSSFAAFILMYAGGMNPLGKASWLGSWIPVVFICIATKIYRDQAGGGYITYWKAFQAGVFTSMAGAFLFALLIYIFGTLVDVSLIEKYRNEILAEMEMTKMFFNAEFYDLTLESIEKITMSQLAQNDFLLKVLGGTLVSFVTAAIFRKLPAESETRL